MGRRNYFSCSSFADIIRGTKKIHSGTVEQWDEWNQSAKMAHPLRFWVAEEGLDYIQDFLNMPSDLYHSIRYYIKNRYINKTWCLKSKSLKKGEWVDLPDRYLECIFSEFVDFVEVELAWAMLRSGEKKKYNAPRWVSWGGWRCAGAGIDYLKWESSLLQKEDWGFKKGDAEYGKPSRQAISAKEKLKIYNWIVNLRPKRPDPHEASGWNKLLAENEEKYGKWYSNKSKKDIQKMAAVAKKVAKLEEKYLNEDTEMLCRIMKIRNDLWT